MGNFGFAVADACWHQVTGTVARPDLMQWYYSKNATQLGPVSEAELRAKLASGEIVGTDMAWREGMANWMPISELAELSLTSQTLRNPPGTAGSTSPYATPTAAGGHVGGYVPPAPTSGLAIASLVCGILGLFCLFLPGIPAVICGHMALNQISNPASGVSGRGMAIAGLVMGYLSLAFMGLWFAAVIFGSLV